MGSYLDKKRIIFRSNDIQNYIHLSLLRKHIDLLKNRKEEGS